MAAFTPLATARRVAAGPREIMLGAVVPLTGVSAPWGRRTWAGVQLACELANAAGGIKALAGAPLSCAVGDSKSRAENAARHAERMIAQGAVAIIGCNQSAASVVVGEIAERSRVPFIISTDLEPALTTRSFAFTFRIGPTLDVYARDLLAYVKDVGVAAGRPPRRLAVLSERSIMGQMASDGVRRAAGPLGFEVVDDRAYDPVRVRAFADCVAGYRRAGVEVVVGHNSLDDAVHIARAMIEGGFTPKACGGVLGGQASPAYVSALGRLAENVLGTAGWWPDMDVPGLATVRSRYQERFREPLDAAAVAGISPIPVLWDALERAGTTDPRALRDAIAATELRAGERMLPQLRGVRFLASGDNDRASALVLVIQDGIPQVAAPREVARARAIYPKPPWGTSPRR